MNYKKSIFTITILTLLLIVPFTRICKGSTLCLSLSQLVKLPESSRERYAYSKALQNSSSFEQEYVKARQAESSYDTRIVYLSAQSTATVTPYMKYVDAPIVNSEAMCEFEKDSNKLIKVLDFGIPYLTTKDGKAVDFDHGGFNINRVNDTSARISATGKFINKTIPLSLGLDIITLKSYNIQNPEVVTIHTILKW